MQKRLDIRTLKTLLISARNSLNSQLTLSRTKQIRYTEKQYFDLVSFLSVFGCCAEDGSATMNLFDDVPTGDALLQQLKKQEFSKVSDEFHELFQKQFYELLPKAKKKKYNAIIIDVHEQETYSQEKKTNSAIRGGKHKNGTNYFFKHLTMQALVKGKLITLGMRFYHRKSQLRELVDELIVYAQRFVKIDVVLLDRGFRDAALLNQLEFRQADVLMPCYKDSKAEEYFAKLGRRNFRTLRYLIASQKTKQAAGVTLLMIRLVNGKEIGFYTTMKGTWLHAASYYLDLYKKRWNIETSYRLQHMFLPKTTSIERVVRLFYFCYAIAMHNLWLIIRQTARTESNFTVLFMKVVLVLFWVTTHLPKAW